MSLKDPNPVSSKRPKRVAVIISNPAVSTTTGWPVGFWWSELTHPYFALTERGYKVEIFNPQGGRCKADAMSNPRDPSGYSSSDLISMSFIATPRLAALVEDTKPVGELDMARFDAIVVAGGQGPMFSVENATALHEKFAAFHDAGKVAAALGHGVAILRYAKLSNGDYLAKGKNVSDVARSRAFYEAALVAGGRDNGSPGPRPNYGPTYHAAFVLDPVSTPTRRPDP